MSHDLLHHHDGRGPSARVAPAWNALCRLSTTHTWLWLVRPGAVDATAAIGLVLLDRLPSLLDALGAGAFGHG